MLDAIFAKRKGMFRWLEPSAGRGAILDALVPRYKPASVVAVELHHLRFQELEAKWGDRAACFPFDFFGGDFSRRDRSEPPWFIPGNPPYSKPRENIGLEFVERCLEIAMPDGVVTKLLPLDFAAGVERAERVHDKYVGSIYPLRRRPSFTGGGKSGERPYAWFVWDLLNPKREWRCL